MSSQSTNVTDGQTDDILIAIQRLTHVRASSAVSH